MTYEEYEDLTKIKIELSEILDKLSHYLNAMHYMGFETGGKHADQSEQKHCV